MARVDREPMKMRDIVKGVAPIVGSAEVVVYDATSRCNVGVKSQDGRGSVHPFSVDKIYDASRFLRVMDGRFRKF